MLSATIDKVVRGLLGFFFEQKLIEHIYLEKNVFDEEADDEEEAENEDAVDEEEAKNEDAGVDVVAVVDDD